VKPITISALVAALAVAAGLAAVSPAGIGPAVAATAPPTPPPIDAPMPAPTPSSIAPPNGPQFPPPATPAGSPGASATPSPTPPPDARKGLEGVWEVQIQRGSTTDYTHFKLNQAGQTLSGTYLDARGKRYPLAGSVDGPSIRLIVTLPDGTTILMEGRLDGTTDMIGMLTTAKEQVPFTAAYRPKEKWIENVNPAPGGLGVPNSGSGSPGGYTPPKR